MIAFVSALVTIVAVAFVYEAFFTEKTDQSMKVGFVYVDDESTAYTYNFLRAQNAVDAAFDAQVETIPKYNVPEGKETVIRRDGSRYIVEGKWLFNLMNQVNFDDYESMNYFQRILLKSGVFHQLEEAGCRDGDTVSIYDFEFDYVK